MIVVLDRSARHGFAARPGLHSHTVVGCPADEVVGAGRTAAVVAPTEVSAGRRPDCDVHALSNGRVTSSTAARSLRSVPGPQPVDTSAFSLRTATDLAP